MPDAQRSDLVTVVVVVFNGEAFLPFAIESVLRQTHANLELLIVDDGSTDGSAEVVRRFERSDGRVRLVSHAANRGIGAARKTGILEARTTWVMTLDADDCLLPDCLETQLRQSNENPEAKVISGRGYKIGTSGQRIGTSTLTPLSRSRLADIAESGEPIPLLNPGTLCHRPTVLEIGNYREEMTAQEDVDLWARVIEAGFVVITHDTFIVEYRYWAGSCTASAGTTTYYRFLWLRERASCRRENRPEPSLDTFLEVVRNRPLFERLADRRSALVAYLFRSAGLLHGERAWFDACWRLVAAFCLAPVMVSQRLWKHMVSRSLWQPARQTK